MPLTGVRTTPESSHMLFRLATSLLALTACANAHSGLPQSVVAPSHEIVARSAKLTDQLPKSLRRTAAAISIDIAQLKSRVQTGSVSLEKFPLGAMSSATLELKLIDIPHGDSQVVAADAHGERVIDIPQALVLAGRVKDDAESFAFLASSAAGTYGVVETQGRTWIISSGPYGAGLPTLSYELDALPEGAISWSEWVCDTIDPEVPPSAAFAEGGVASAPCRELRLAFETDHEFLQMFGGNTAAAGGYVQTIVAALNSIYSRDLNARISSSFVRLWVDPQDPWIATTAAGQLYEFRTTWLASMGYVQRDCAQFLSGRALGGGVAYLNGLCNTNGFAVNSNLTGFFPYPLLNNHPQNWDIFVVAHELGHNLGAPHTHAYNPVLDGCGSSPPDCSVAVAKAGTIMSYCHLCGGGLSNIRMELHPGNVATMENYIASLACDFSGTNLPPAALNDSKAGFAATEISIDVLANDSASNCDALTITSFNATSAQGASIVRSVATGPEGRDELVYTHANPNFSGADSFSYMVAGLNGQSTTATVSMTITALRAPENPIGVVSQLDARYYTIGTLTALPNFSGMSATVVNAASSLNYPASTGNFATSGMSDHVAAKFEGWLTVPVSGAWTFSLESDDGSKMYLGATVVINNDGVHTMTTQNAVIGLQAGTHAFRLEYFDNTGIGGCVLSWAPPSGLAAPIPASAFVRGGEDDPADFNNDGQINAGDLTILLSHWGEVNATFDLNNSGRVDSGDLTIILNGWTG